MSDRQYAERRIRDALDKASGNVARARQQIIAWTYEDAKLLHALTKPHLSGIVSYNIERIVSGRSAAPENPAQPKEEAAPAKAKEENFGLEILKAVAGNNGSTFGLETYSAPRANKPTVSKNHIDAIKAMTKGRKSD